MKFNVNQSGNWVGYHWYATTLVDGEKFISFDRKQAFGFYLSSKPTEWYPDHLKRNETLLVIEFTPPEKELVFDTFDDYHSVVPRNLDDILALRDSTKYADYDLISLYENDRDELQESWLMYPSQSIVTIEAFFNIKSKKDLEKALKCSRFTHPNI